MEKKKENCLKRLCDENGLDSKSLAKRLNMIEANVNGWLIGIKRPRKKSIGRLAILFGLTVKELNLMIIESFPRIESALCEFCKQNFIPFNSSTRFCNRLDCKQSRAKEKNKSYMEKRKEIEELNKDRLKQRMINLKNAKEERELLELNSEIVSWASKTGIENELKAFYAKGGKIQKKKCFDDNEEEEEILLKKESANTNQFNKFNIDLTEL